MASPLAVEYFAYIIAETGVQSDFKENCLASSTGDVRERLYTACVNRTKLFAIAEASAELCTQRSLPELCMFAMACNARILPSDASLGAWRKFWLLQKIAYVWNS